MTKLSEKAVLIKVYGKTWRGVVKDKEATATAAANFNTTDKWVTLSKRLVDPAILQQPKKILGAARNYLRGNTDGALDGERITGGLPAWDNDGRHILPNALNEKVLRNLGEFQSKFEKAVDELAKILPGAIEQARQENPDLFKDADYDSADAIIENYYEMGRELDMIPDSNDIRVTASAEFVAALKGEVEDRANKRLNEVAEHTRSAIIDTIRHFADSLSDYDPDNKRATAFRDSTVDKVRELVPVARALNIDGDARVDNALTDIVNVLGNRSAASLREDADDRQHVAAEATKLADNLTSIFN
jgi:hypothetical protein